MSWNHTQEEYTEFIRIWNSSVSSCDALARLKASPRFGVAPGPNWKSSDPVARERNYIQGIAGALRHRGVTLKRLVMEDANRAKPPVQDRHLDFHELRSLSITY